MTAEAVKIIDAYLDCARMARRLAHEWRRSAQEFPKYATTDLAEAAKAFERARWYLRSVRLWRAEA